MRRAAALAMAAGALALHGCVAAVLPLAAGAAMTQSRVAANKGKQDVAPQPQTSVQLLPLSELPPPDFARPSSVSAVEAFRGYALAAATPDGQADRSALLADGAGMAMDRVACPSDKPAVLIDLDPGRGSFDPLGQFNPAKGLAQALADLRRAGIAVVWLSRLGENFAAPTRAALARSGLDPAGEDRLVLMRDIEERKQTRRQELAKELCPLALLGDERADFDELFLYLKRPESAVALEPMIGKGWFLASPVQIDPIERQAGTIP